MKRYARAVLRRAQWIARGRSVEPFSRKFGADRGKPIDRYYIERFLEQYSSDIAGDVLEIAEDHYTRRYGGERVARSHVLHATRDNPAATVVGDLATGEGVPTAAYSCMILTQTLQFIYDMHGAVLNCHRALRPGGVLLASLSGISQISRYDMDRWGDYWRVTSKAAERLFGDVFGAGNVTVAAHGNLVVAKAFLSGMAVEDLSARELEHRDPDYEVLITVRAVKA